MLQRFEHFRDGKRNGGPTTLAIFHSSYSLMRYERLQRRRLDQSLSAPVSEPQATCEPQASSGYAESTSSFRTSEATGSIGSQAMPDGELEDEETCDTVSEADEVATEDVIEVMNLDFSDDYSYLKNWICELCTFLQFRSHIKMEHVHRVTGGSVLIHNCKG